MTEYKIGRATVRIHGNPDQEKIKAATVQFLKKVEANRKKKKVHRRNENEVFEKSV
jgi:hypothetical protein